MTHLIIQKSITDSCKFYKTKFVEAGSKAELGKFTGADSRAVVSVNDDNFAKAILDRLKRLIPLGHGERVMQIWQIR